MIDDFWEKIDGLTFYPWKGPNYEKNSVFGVRILVMGESTHGAMEEDLRKQWGAAYFVKHDVLESIKGEGEWRASPFWTKWINGLLGREMCCLRERRTVLYSVAYWNYADCPPLSGNRTGPPPRYLCEANGKLRSVIAKLKPDLVILMSKGLRDNLLNGADQFENQFNAEHRKDWENRLGGHKFHFLTINHPTSGFSIAKDWPAIQAAIKECGGWQPEKIACR